MYKITKAEYFFTHGGYVPVEDKESQPVRCSDSRDVYYKVLELLGVEDPANVDEENHMTAADAEGWCELHGAEGETYNGKGFVIEVVED